MITTEGQTFFAGKKALDPYYCRQLTLSLHDLYLKVLTVHGTELHLFLGQGIRPTHTINVEYRTHHLPDAEHMR